MNSWVNALFPLLKAVKDPSITNVLPSIWIGLTFLFFIGSGIWFYRSQRRCRKDIQRVLGILSEYNKPSDVIKDFEPLNQKLSNTSSIGHFWSEFSETFVFPPKENGGAEQIFNTIDAHNYFNETNLMYKRFNVSFYKAVPTVLTALGILGTFLGLTFGLSQIDLASPKISVLREGIEGLLSGASMAFSTSVWGIGLSTIFLMFKRVKLRQVEAYVTDLQSKIDQLFIHKTPEALLSEVLHESRQQTQELKTFNTDLATSIASALDEKLAHRLTPTFEGLLVAIEELTKTGVSQVAKTITEGAGAEITKLNEVLSKVGETLRNTVSSSQETQQRMNENLTNYLGNLSHTINALLETIGKQQEAFNANTQEAIHNLISKIETTLSRQQKQIENITTTATERLMHVVSNVSSELSNLVNNLGQRTSAVSETMREEMGDFTMLIKEKVEELGKNYQNANTQFNDLLNRLGTTLKQTEDIVEGAGLTVESLSQGTSSIKEASITLVKAVQDMQNSQKSFVETVSQSQILLKDHVFSIEESVTHVRQVLEKTQSAWQSYEGRFGDIEEELKAVFEELGKGLREYRQETTKGVTEFLTQFDKYMGEATSQLGGAIETFQDGIDGLNEVLEKIRGLRMH